MNAACGKGIRQVIGLMAVLAALTPGVSMVLRPSRALAAKVITLDLQVGETYIIHNVDADTTAVVSYGYNSNSFTVKRGGLSALTVFTFQPGRGTVQATVGGEDVLYRVTVHGLIDAAHPLLPGTAPPALNDEIAATLYGEASGVKGPGPVSYPGNPGSGPVAANASNPGIGYSNAGTTTRTETVGQAFSAGPQAPAQSGGGQSLNSVPALILRRLLPALAQYHQQYRQPVASTTVLGNQPAILDQSACGRARGYVTNLAFGGRHNLPPDTISITAGTSQVYDFGGPISRVSVANTTVADVQVMGNHQLMIVGHQPGFSSLVVWDSQGNYVERQIWTEIAGISRSCSTPSLPRSTSLAWRRWARTFRLR